MVALVGSPFGWFLGWGSLDFDKKKQVFEAGKVDLVLVNGEKVGWGTAVRPGSSFVGRRVWWGNGRQVFPQLLASIGFVSF